MANDGKWRSYQEPFALPGRYSYSRTTIDPKAFVAEGRKTEHPGCLILLALPPTEAEKVKGNDPIVPTPAHFRDQSAERRWGRCWAGDLYDVSNSLIRRPDAKVIGDGDYLTSLSDVSIADRAGYCWNRLTNSNARLHYAARPLGRFIAGRWLFPFP